MVEAADQAPLSENHYLKSDSKKQHARCFQLCKHSYSQLSTYLIVFKTCMQFWVVDEVLSTSTPIQNIDTNLPYSSLVSSPTKVSYEQESPALESTHKENK